MDNRVYGTPTPLAFNQNNNYYGGNPYYNYQTVQMQNMRMPNMQNALTSAEIQTLLTSKPNGSLNLQIDQIDSLRAMCNHKDGTRECVHPVNDGTGDVICDICGERWNPATSSKEEIADLIKTLNDQMQNVKYVGEFPVNIGREYFQMIPLLKKFPELYEYASRNMDRLNGQNGYNIAGDATIYAQIDSLMGGYTPYPQYSQGYGYNPYQPQYVNQAANPYQQPVYNQPPVNPQGNYNPYQQQPMGNMAMPGVNPMQSSPYGVQPPTIQGTPQYGAPAYAPQNQQNFQVQPQGMNAAPIQQPVFAPQPNPSHTVASPQPNPSQTPASPVKEVKNNKISL